jgi:hypothetical protein
MMTRDEFRAAMHGPLRMLLQAALREEAARRRVLVAVVGTVTPNPAACATTEAAILDLSDTLFDAFGADRAQEAQPT